MGARSATEETSCLNFDELVGSAARCSNVVAKFLGLTLMKFDKGYMQPPELKQVANRCMQTIHHGKTHWQKETEHYSILMKLLGYITWTLATH